MFVFDEFRWRLCCSILLFASFVKLTSEISKSYMLYCFRVLCGARFSHRCGKLLFSRRTNRNEIQSVNVGDAPKIMLVLIFCVFICCIFLFLSHFLNVLILNRNNKYNFCAQLNDKCTTKKHTLNKSIVAKIYFVSFVTLYTDQI